jgi:hypothetical protein
MPLSVAKYRLPPDRPRHDCPVHRVISASHNEKNKNHGFFKIEAEFWLLGHRFERSKTTQQEACQGRLQPASRPEETRLQGYAYTDCCSRWFSSRSPWRRFLVMLYGCKPFVPDSEVTSQLNPVADIRNQNAIDSCPMAREELYHCNQWGWTGQAGQDDGDVSPDGCTRFVGSNPKRCRGLWHARVAPAFFPVREAHYSAYS